MKTKLIYFVMGEAGSGKTVLSNQLADKVKGESQVFDDVQFITTKPKGIFEMRKELSSVRHTGKTIFINTWRPSSLHVDWDFRANKYVTWIITSMSYSEYKYLLRMGLNQKYLKKMFNAWRNVCMKKGLKTRPYLSITLDKNRRVKYEYHRYKKPNDEVVN